MASPMYRIRQLIVVITLILSAYLLISSLNVSSGEYRPGRAQRFEEKVTEKPLGSPKDWDRLATKNDLDRDENPVEVVVSHSDRDILDVNVNAPQSVAKKESLMQELACNVPKLDINGSEVIGFFKTHPPLKCQLENSGIENNWVYVDSDGILRFSEKRKLASCKLRYFWRIDDNKNRYGDPIVINDGFIMNGSDYASVACIQGFTKWSSILWDVNNDEKIHERARKMKRLNQKAYNVYFLGIDSLSQMSYRRKLPKTVKFIEETLGSVTLDGYNIVGDGTPQAFIPILTAKTEVELPLTRKRYKEANYVDDVYPFIWKNFSEAGYVTMYAEDAFNIGTFTYRLKGFRNQPTDHYTRTLFEEVERLNDRNCIGSIPLHRMWFQNGRKFMKVYEDVPRFLLMHQSLLSHDDINFVGVEDDDLAAHMKQMNDEGFFDDSIVIMMADHGHRFAKLRDTHQGQLEERMPFFSIALPKSLKDTPRGQLMYKNLMENKEKLTSPFDIHASLMDVLNLANENEDDTAKFEQLQNVGSERSLSVFRPIPENRSCGQAGIEPHWCTCLSWQDAMATDEDRIVSERIANAVLKEINNELEPEKELCAPLSISKIIGAKKLLPGSGLLAYKNVKDADGFVPDLSGHTKAAFAHYQIKIQTIPGVAIYEITVFYDILKNEVKLDFGSISHVNKFGDTPHCIIDKNYYLATFCVCYDKI